MQEILITERQRAMLEMFSATQFWVDVFKIIMIDLLLSGDNAVVIALACRNLPEAQRRRASVRRRGRNRPAHRADFLCVGLLSLPYLKLIGALLLLWIGIKLILPEEEHGADNIKADTRLFGAVQNDHHCRLRYEPGQRAGVASSSQGQRVAAGNSAVGQYSADCMEQPAVLKLIDRFPLIHLCVAGRCWVTWRARCWSPRHCSQDYKNAHYLHWLVR